MSVGGSTSITVEHEDCVAEKRKRERWQVSHLRKEILDLIDCPKKKSKERFRLLVQDSRWDKPENSKSRGPWRYSKNLQTKRAWFPSVVQDVLAKMLENIPKYQFHLRIFIERFEIQNEPIFEKSYSGDLCNAPLHYAVTQLNGAFVAWLLNRPKIDVNVRNSRMKTPLAILCGLYDRRMGKRTQFQMPQSAIQSILDAKDIRKLILQLLRAGADFNIYADEIGLPFDLLLKHRAADNESESFIEQCIELHDCSPITLSTTDQGDPALMTHKGNLDQINVTVELLEIFLHYKDIESFQKYWETFSVTTENAKKVISLLLLKALDKTLWTCAEQIIGTGSEVIFETSKERKLVNEIQLHKLLIEAFRKCDIHVLRLIVSNSNGILFETTLLLHMIIYYAHKPHIERRDELLDYAAELATSNDSEVLYLTDSNGDTALHLALKYGFEKLALIMLNKEHPLLFLRNKAGLMPLSYGTQKFWKPFLDKYIETPDWEDRTTLKMDLNCLRLNKPSEVETSEEERLAPDGSITEMTAVSHIAESERLNQLLMHPIIYSFVMIKWIRLCHWNYLNLLLTSMTIFSFAWYSLTTCSAEGPSTTLWVLSLLGVLFMGARELIQLWLLRMSYISLDNPLDMANLVLMAVVLASECNGLLSSFVVISLALQLTFLIGLLPFNNVSTILSMFKRVSRNFFYSLLLFTPLIGSFIYAFYHSNNGSRCMGDRARFNAASSAEEDFNNFRTFWNAAIKTLVMTTGEFEAASVDFDGGKLFLFVAFLFVAPMVIMNLVNGLAVSDIAAIRKESEIISIRQKVNLIQRYESGLANMPNCVRKLVPKPFFNNNEGFIFIETQFSNRVLVASHQSDNYKPVPLLPGIPTRWLHFRLSKIALFMRLDNSIVYEALAIADNSPYDGEHL